MAIYLDQPRSYDLGKITRDLDIPIRILVTIGMLAIATSPSFYNLNNVQATQHIPNQPAGVPLDGCYTAQPGDTLSKIGTQMNPPHSWEDLWKINGDRSNFKSPDKLKTGDKVALIQDGCSIEDQQSVAPLVDNSEQGITDVRGNAYELTVTAKGETIESVAKNLNVNPSSILALNPTINKNVSAPLPEATLLVIPASQKARLESAFLESEHTLLSGSWQLAASISEIRGSRYGTEGTNDIMSALGGRKVQAVLFEKESGKAIRKDGSITGVYEDAKHQGHFIVGFRTTLGNEVFLSFWSLLVKIE